MNCWFWNFRLIRIPDVRPTLWLKAVFGGASALRYKLLNLCVVDKLQDPLVWSLERDGAIALLNLKNYIKIKKTN
jgi:hypothetical protein